MRSEIFKQMKMNREGYFKSIKSFQNPNPFKHDVKDNQKKIEIPIEIIQKPLLKIERVPDSEDEKNCVMDDLGTIRKTGLANWFYKIMIRKINEWFEIDDDSN